MPVKLIIAISGASGSGKSYFAGKLVELLTRHHCHAQLIGEDDYYKANDHLSLPERAAQNYDHPDAFEHELLVEHLQLLKQGQRVSYPEYCYRTHTRIGAHVVHPAQVLVLEGLMLFTYADLLPLCDLKVYLDTPLDVCLLRRLKRDVEQRGRTTERVFEQWESTVKPMYFEYLQPSCQHADIVVPSGSDNSAALQMIADHVLYRVSKDQ